MTVWIEQFNNQFSDDWTFAAYLGFSQMGYVISSFHKKEKIHYKKGDIVVGCIQTVRYITDKLEIVLPDLYIPEGLEDYAGRTITKSTIGDILTRKKEKLFIKPIQAKVFPAQVLDEKFPLTTYCGQTLNDSMECWVSDVVNFISEYRIFMRNGQIIGCKHYWGDYRIPLDWKIVDEAISKIKKHYAGWTIDFGVTDTGKTLIIESNDGYSIGNYGLEGKDYAELLRDRWIEITRKD